MQRKDLHFWADEDYPEEQRPKDPKTFGISAVQFILTSSIVIHTLPLYRGGSVYINLFSCKDFDHTAAREFTVEWFKAEEYIETEVARR
jgi:S-adenosylmethionine/arginine decarboxylase-like enzyme